MQQLTQKLGSGEMVIQELPMPQVEKGMVLIKNHYSLISAGTEGSTVSTARKNLLAKAKERPQQVKQVLDVLKKQGPIPTYRAVMKKLDAYSPLGYSSAGEVIAVGKNVTDFKAGDKVACAGVGYANHAEIISVPVNLCVKLNPDANMQDAAYNTLGAISLQGVRQADLRLGENCVVIGLGLLGQLTCLELKASGVKVIGVDINEEMVKIAQNNHAVDLACTRNTSGIEDLIHQFTNGIGADAVIIAAATSSLDPINFAGAVLRKKGTVVVLGAVPTGFDRDPHFYKKELQLKMACSYGPGRYDLNYEEKGIDYPVAYVRWTEKRNMEAFQDLIHSEKMDISYLTTHQFIFDEAPKAFDLVVNKTEPFIGLLLKYDTAKTHQSQKIVTHTKTKEGTIKLSFVGAGSYAQGSLLPYIPKSDNIEKVGVLTHSGTTSKRVAEKYQFQYCTDNEQDIFNSGTNTIFITTRHNTHADYVLKGLNKGMNVFVEKPICLTLEELNLIKETQNESPSAQIMVGFNRRFSPLTQALKKKIKEGAMSMIYRINAGAIPKNSWIQDPEIGGGRIIGEVVHFIDYLSYINGSLPISVAAQSLSDADGLNDTVNILIKFKNGSTGVVAYYANGAKDLPKEYIEVFSAGTTAIISDFKSLKIYGKGKPFKKNLINQNKGQGEMVNAFFNSLTQKGISPIPFEDIYTVTKATLLSIESIKEDGKLFKLE